MDKETKHIFFQRRYTNGQQVHGKIFNITNYQGHQGNVKTILNIKTILRYYLTGVRLARIKQQEIRSVGEDVKKGNACALVVGM